MRHQRLRFALVGLLGTGLIAGCAAGPGGYAGRLDDQAATRSPAESTEEATRAAVEAKLAASDESVAFQNVRVEAFGDVVALSGTVDTQRERERAARLAEEVEGVRQVINRLELESVD